MVSLRHASWRRPHFAPSPCIDNYKMQYSAIPWHLMMMAEESLATFSCLLSATKWWWEALLNEWASYLTGIINRVHFHFCSDHICRKILILKHQNHIIWYDKARNTPIDWWIFAFHLEYGRRSLHAQGIVKSEHGTLHQWIITDKARLRLQPCASVPPCAK